MYGLMNTGLAELVRIQTGERRTKRARLSRRYRQRIYWRDDGKCVYCASPVRFAEMTIDHVKPLVSKGRARLKENCVVACNLCNKRKGPLQQEILDNDLTPYALAEKFYRVTKSAAERKGHYTDFVAALDNVSP